MQATRAHMTTIKFLLFFVVLEQGILRYPTCTRSLERAERRLVSRPKMPTVRDRNIKKLRKMKQRAKMRTKAKMERLQAGTSPPQPVPLAPCQCGCAAQAASITCTAAMARDLYCVVPSTQLAVKEERA